MKDSRETSPEEKTPRETSPEEIIIRAAEKWPSSIVARSEVKTFSRGLISAGTMANHDSQGNGPKGGFCVGRKRCYPVESLCDWLIERIGDDDPRHCRPGDKQRA